jgi:hypothetical protein
VYRVAWNACVLLQECAEANDVAELWQSPSKPSADLRLTHETSRRAIAALLAFLDDREASQYSTCFQSVRSAKAD